MRFLVDAQLPQALARWLVREGFEAEHVADVGLAASSDTAIWVFATPIAAVIITKDEDFARRRMLAVDGPTVLWVRLPNTRTAELIAWFATVLPDVLAALRRGETLIEMT